MKKSPTIDVGRKLRLDSKTTEFLEELGHKAAADQKNMEPWLQRKAEAYRRRFNLDADRPVNFPWPNASNIMLPFSDIAIDESLPALMNLQFGNPRIVAFRPRNVDSMQQARNAEMTLEWLLRHRMGERGEPDYMRQSAFSAASFLQHGLCVDKVYYSYVTRTAMETLYRTSLPDRLQRIQVVDDIDPEQQQMLQQQLGVLAVTREQFDQLGPQIERIVVEEFGLDTAETVDAEYLRDMMKFLRRNNPDAKITMRAKQVLEDNPRVVNVPITDISVPRGTRSIATARRVSHDIYLTEEDFRQRAMDNGWNDDAVSAVLASAPTVTRHRQGSAGQTHDRGPVYRAGWESGARLHDALRERSGFSGTVGAEEHIRVTEIYAYKLERNRIPVPIVVTMSLAHGARGVLSAQEYPFAHGNWPFVDTHMEYLDADFFASRGLPEKMRVLERWNNALIRYQLDSMTIQVTPTFLYNPTSTISPEKVRYVPGAWYPRRRQGDVEVMQMPVSALALERPMAQIQTIMERVTGSQMNQRVRDAKLERPPTATDINERSLQRQELLGLRGMAFQEGRARIFQQVWALWRQFGPFQFEAAITGEEPVRLTQHQIRGDFDIIPTGAVADMDPQAKLQQNLMLLDVLAKSQPFVGQDPRYVVDIPTAIKRVLDMVDPLSSDLLMRRRTPEEVQQILAAQQQEAQRQAAIKDEADRLQQGASTTMEGAQAVMEQIRKLSPQKDLQAVRSQAEGVIAQAQNSASLARN